MKQIVSAAARYALSLVLKYFILTQTTLPARYGDASATSDYQPCLILMANTSQTTPPTTTLEPTKSLRAMAHDQLVPSVELQDQPREEVIQMEAQIVGEQLGRTFREAGIQLSRVRMGVLIRRSKV
jgi:hypothetical protein